jgi:hypothetical protein
MSPHLDIPKSADRLVDFGFHLVKLKPYTKQPAGGRDWQQRIATRPPKWTGEYNIGIMGGTEIQPGKRLLILDIDVKNGQTGNDSIQRIQEIYEPLPRTAEASTPSGGRHLYYLVPEETPLTGIRGILQQLEFPGVELIGEGLYVVAPPSVFADIPYEWFHWPEETLSFAPLWLVHLLKISGRPRISKCEKSQGKMPERLTKRPTPPDADHLLKEIIQRFPVFGPGQRNAKMHQAVITPV